MPNFSMGKMGIERVSNSRDIERVSKGVSNSNHFATSLPAFTLASFRMFVAGKKVRLPDIFGGIENNSARKHGGFQYDKHNHSSIKNVTANQIYQRTTTARVRQTIRKFWLVIYKISFVKVVIWYVNHGITNYCFESWIHLQNGDVPTRYNCINFDR